MIGKNDESKEPKNLLQSRREVQKNVKARPESAKLPPAKTVKAVKTQPNTNDISSMMAQNKKFQMLKKLKEEKEKKKEVIVRQLQKSNVLTPAQKKQKQKKEPVKEPAVDDFFQEEEIKGGDQALNVEEGAEAGEDEFNMLDSMSPQPDQQKPNASAKQEDPKVKKREEGWKGNQLGSGQYQGNQQPIQRDNANVQLDKTK